MSHFNENRKLNYVGKNCYQLSHWWNYQLPLLSFVAMDGKSGAEKQCASICYYRLMGTEDSLATCSSKTVINDCKVSAMAHCFRVIN